MNQSVRLSTVICFCHYHYCWRSLLLSLLLALCLPSAGNSPVLCSHLGSAFISKPPSFCLQLRGGCGNKCGNQKILLQGRSERCPGKGGNHQRWQNITVPASFQLFVFVAAREAACDPGASNWQHTAGRSRHDVLHPQACECCSCQHLYSCQLCTSSAHLQLSAF